MGIDDDDDDDEIVHCPWSIYLQVQLRSVLSARPIHVKRKIKTCSVSSVYEAPVYVSIATRCSAQRVFGNIFCGRYAFAP